MSHRAYEKGKTGKGSKLLKEDAALDRVALEADDFRRVAILRDVHPQIMPKDRNSPWSYFHKDDLRLINNDPMSWFIREYSSWQKHHQKKVNRKEEDGRPAPVAPYAELIHSRYPTPADAIKDLDDALTTVALFAQMTGSDLIDSERILKCRKLLAEFHYFVSRTHCLTKSFISVRGFFFEATIEGLPVTWLIPHQFPFEMDQSVDYKVLIDFLELYENLIGFMNARLFIQIGMKYPPTFDNEKWDKGFYIDSIMDAEPKEAEQEQKPETDESKKASEAMSAALNQAASEMKADGEEEAPATKHGLFDGLVFTIDRSVPRDPITLVIRSLGGQIVWNEDSQDSRITHTITDRSSIKTHTFGRQYVQPQWVFDSLNKKALIDVSLYRPGAQLPPHISPFENNPVKMEGDQQPAEVDDEGSDKEIDEEVKRIALEQEYAAGVAVETKGEKVEEKADLTQLKAEMKQKRKEEKERLAASTLSSAKSKLYKELKEKEDAKKNKKKKSKNVDEDAEQAKPDEEFLEEEDKE